MSHSSISLSTLTKRDWTLSEFIKYITPHSDYTSLEDLVAKINRNPPPVALFDPRLTPLVQNLILRQFQQPIFEAPCELLSNSLDAQWRNNTENQPILIKIFQNTLKIKDRGGGLINLINYLVPGRSSNPQATAVLNVTGRFGQGALSQFYFIIDQLFAETQIKITSQTAHERLKLRFWPMPEKEIGLDIVKMDCIDRNYGCKIKICSPLIQQHGANISKRLQETFAAVSTTPIFINETRINPVGRFTRVPLVSGGSFLFTPVRQGQQEGNVQICENGRAIQVWKVKGERIPELIVLDFPRLELSQERAQVSDPTCKKGLEETLNWVIQACPYDMRLVFLNSLTGPLQDFELLDPLRKYIAEVNRQEIQYLPECLKGPIEHKGFLPDSYFEAMPIVPNQTTQDRSFNFYLVDCVTTPHLVTFQQKQHLFIPSSFVAQIPLELKLKIGILKYWCEAQNKPLKSELLLQTLLWNGQSKDVHYQDTSLSGFSLEQAVDWLKRHNAPNELITQITKNFLYRFSRQKVVEADRLQVTFEIIRKLVWSGEVSDLVHDLFYLDKIKFTFLKKLAENSQTGLDPLAHTQYLIYFLQQQTDIEQFQRNQEELKSLFLKTCSFSKALKLTFDRSLFVHLSAYLSQNSLSSFENILGKLSYVELQQKFIVLFKYFKNIDSLEDLPAEQLQKLIHLLPDNFPPSSYLTFTITLDLEPLLSTLELALPLEALKFWCNFYVKLTFAIDKFFNLSIKNEFGISKTIISNRAGPIFKELILGINKEFNQGMLSKFDAPFFCHFAHDDSVLFKKMISLVCKIDTHELSISHIPFNPQKLQLELPSIKEEIAKAYSIAEAFKQNPQGALKPFLDAWMDEWEALGLNSDIRIFVQALVFGSSLRLGKPSNNFPRFDLTHTVPLQQLIGPSIGSEELAFTRIANAMNQRMEPYVWCLELIKNGIEAEANKISISLFQEEDELIVIITDNGSGFIELPVPGKSSKDHQKNFGWGFYSLFRFFDESFVLSGTKTGNGIKICYVKEDLELKATHRSIKNSEAGTKIFLRKKRATLPVQALLIERTLRQNFHLFPASQCAIFFQDILINSTSSAAFEYLSNHDLNIRLCKGASASFFSNNMRIGPPPKEWDNYIPSKIKEILEQDQMGFHFFLPFAEEVMNRGSLAQQEKFLLILQKEALKAALIYTVHELKKGRYWEKLSTDFWSDFKAQLEEPNGDRDAKLISTLLHLKYDGDSLYKIRSTFMQRLCQENLLDQKGEYVLTYILQTPLNILMDQVKRSCREMETTMASQFEKALKKTLYSIKSNQEKPTLNPLATQPLERFVHNFIQEMWGLDVTAQGLDSADRWIAKASNRSIIINRRYAGPFLQFYQAYTQAQSEIEREAALEQFVPVLLNWINTISHELAHLQNGENCAHHSPQFYRFHTALLASLLSKIPQIIVFLRK